MAMAPNTSVDTGEVESSRVALEKAFDSLRKGVDTVVDAFNHIVEKVNHYRWIIGPVGMYFIKNHLDDIRTHLKQALDIAEKVVQSGTPVLSLFLTSIDYLAAVEKPLGDVSYGINTPADDNLQYWS